MRKLSLLAAAAMVAGGSAFAMDGGGVSISGTANFGVKFAESDDDSKSELQFHHEFDVKFSASGTTDGGIGFGGSMSIDNREDVTSGKVTAAKTGYIVTENDKTADLNARFGFDASGLVAGDVIESGNKANLSGYGKAKIDTHNVAVAATTSNVDVGGSISRAVEAIATITDAEGGDGRSTAAVGRGATAINLIRFTRTVDGVETTEYVWTTQDVATINDFEDASDAAILATGRVTVAQTVVAAVEGAGGLEDLPAITTPATIQIDTITSGQNAPTAADRLAGGLTQAVAASTRVLSHTGPELAVKMARSQAYINSLSASVAASDKQKVNNHGEVYISMDMHKLTIGSDLAQADQLAAGGNDGLADPGFDGIGIDDVAEGVWGKSAADVRYDGDFGVAKVAISYGDNAGDADWAAGFTFNVDPVNFGAGFDSHGVMSVGMGFTQGAIAMSAMYSTDSDHDEADNEGFACSADLNDQTKAAYSAVKHGACVLNNNQNIANKPDLKNQAMGVDVSYQMNETTSVVLVAAQHKKESAHLSYKAPVVLTGQALAAAQAADNPTTTNSSLTWSKSSTTVDAFGVGFSHDLGGGATLKAGAGSVDSNAVADLGITMKF